MADRKSCDLCPKTFARKQGLYTHKQSHRDGKKYNRSQCNKSFSHNANLKTHSLIHTAVYRGETAQVQLFSQSSR